jgi:tRNA(Ile)-lysidine synthase
MRDCARRASIAPCDPAVSFTPERLRAALESAFAGIAGPAAGSCIALSGGLDSTVLLAGIAGLAGRGDVALWQPVRAIHVDHGLHRDAARWSEHSASVARSFGIGCEVVRVDARPAAGESPEAVARAARYGALAERLRPGEVLLTAHHADDQLETVLLQWLRGGGLRSIAGMAPVAPFARGWLARPLLGFARDELRDWARAAGLVWLEDPSNLDVCFDRNYLRLEVLPAVRRRWPAAARTVGRVAGQAAEALELDAQAAAADLAAAGEAGTLSLSAMRALAPARQRRLLRAWLRSAGLPIPAAATLEALRRDVLAAAGDRVPRVCWPGVVVHRYRERLYAIAASTEARPWSPGAWQPGQAFDLGQLGKLELQPAHGEGLSRARLTGALAVEPRPSGGSFRPAGSAHHRPLRKWLQERGVLPWLRSQLPIVAFDGEIVAIGDLACGGGLAAAPDEDSWRITWHGRPPLTEAESIASRR